MAYKTLCEQGHHEYSLGLNVQTVERCIYCGERRQLATIKRGLRAVIQRLFSSK